MAFDVNGALKAGYSMTEIADHLARGAKFNSMSARQAGYSDEEIVNHLLQGKGKQVPARQSVAPADVRAMDSSLVSTPDVTAPVTDSFISAKAPVAAAQPSKRRASSDINPELRSAPQQSIIARGLNAVRRALSPYDTTEAMDPADIASAQIAMETGKGTDTVVEPSRRIEKAIKPLPGLAASTLQQGEGGLVREVGEMSPNTRAAYLGPVAGPLSMLVPWDKITEAGKSYAESGVKEEKRLREKYPAEPGTLTSMVQSAGQSFGMQLIPMLSSIVTANPAPALAAMSGITMGQTYHDYRERGHSPEASAIAAAGQGIIEGGTELLPVTKLLNIAGGKQALVKSLIGLYGSEVPGEMIATLTQDMIDKSMIRPNMTVGEMGQEIKKYFASGEAALAQKETVGSTLIQTTATAGLGVGARTLTRAAANLNNRTDPITGGLTITSPAASGMPLLTQEQAARRDKLSNIMQGETEEAEQERLQAIEARKQGASRGLTAATAPATPQTAAPQEPVTAVTRESVPATGTIVDEALEDPEASRKALTDLEARHAKLKSKIFDEEGNQREGISQKLLDNYNALTATIENQRAKLTPEVTAGEEATNGQEVQGQGRGQEVAESYAIKKGDVFDSPRGRVTVTDASDKSTITFRTEAGATFTRGRKALDGFAPVAQEEDVEGVAQPSATPTQVDTDTEGLPGRPEANGITTADHSEEQANVSDTPHYRVVPQDTPLEETPDHWTTNSLEDAKTIQARMQESDGIPRKIVEVDPQAVAQNGGAPQGKSPYGTGADWVKTDTEVPPSAIVGVVGQGERSTKDKVMTRIEAILPETSPSGHPQTKGHLAQVMAEEGFNVTPDEVEEIARNIRQQGQPTTDAERALTRILADDTRSNRHTYKSGGKVDSQQREAETEKAEVGKEPWEMTREAYWDWTRTNNSSYKTNKKTIEGNPQYLENAKSYTLDDLHRGQVKKALSEGKPIPPEVIAEYPDLQPGAAEETPSDAKKDIPAHVSLPAGWKMEVGKTRTKEGHTFEAEVDWHRKTLVFSEQKHMDNPEIVNHEVAHVRIETLPETKRDALFDEYVKAAGLDEWTVKNNFHHEKIAMDYGDYLTNPDSTPKELKAVFDKHLGEGTPEKKKETISPETRRKNLEKRLAIAKNTRERESIRAKLEKLKKGDEKDPNIGREWNATYGRQRIVAKDTTGPNPLYDVLTVETGAIRRYDANRIEEIVTKDEHRLTPEYEAEQKEQKEISRLREEREARQAEKDKKVADEIAAFTAGMSNMAVGRARDALLKQASFDGNVLTRKEYIEKRIAEGRTVVGEGDDRRLEDADGVGLGVKGLTKTGMDYAEYLLGKTEEGGRSTKPEPSATSKGYQEAIDRMDAVTPTIKEGRENATNPNTVTLDLRNREGRPIGVYTAPYDGTTENAAYVAAGMRMWAVETMGDVVSMRESSLVATDGNGRPRLGMSQGEGQLEITEIGAGAKEGAKQIEGRGAVVAPTVDDEINDLSMDDVAAMFDDTAEEAEEAKIAEEDAFTLTPYEATPYNRLLETLVAYGEPGRVKKEDGDGLATSYTVRIPESKLERFIEEVQDDGFIVVDQYADEADDDLLTLTLEFNQRMNEPVKPPPVPEAKQTGEEKFRAIQRKHLEKQLAIVQSASEKDKLEKQLARLKNRKQTAAAEPGARPAKDNKKEPYFKKGQRVQLQDGSHGEVYEASTMVMRSFLIGGRGVEGDTQEHIHSYEVKKDNGVIRHTSFNEMQHETDPAPEVVPAPVEPKGEARDPDNFLNNISNLRGYAKNSRAAATRARKQEKKAAYNQTAQRYDKEADELQVILDAWADKYPEEAARVLPPKQGTPEAKKAQQQADTGMTFHETKHTKYGHDLFVVSLDERVEMAEYQRLKREAEALGGHYSSFRGRGAIPGFQFREKANAEQFMQEQGGVKAKAPEAEQSYVQKAEDLARQYKAEGKTQADFVNEAPEKLNMVWENDFGKLVTSSSMGNFVRGAFEKAGYKRPGNIAEVWDRANGTENQKQDRPQVDYHAFMVDVYAALDGVQALHNAALNTPHTFEIEYMAQYKKAVTDTWMKLEGQNRTAGEAYQRALQNTKEMLGPQMDRYRDRFAEQRKAQSEQAKESPEQTKTASDILQAAAAEGFKGMGEAAKGLYELFGGGSLKFGLGSFDEETYAKAKPHFEAALKSVREAGKGLKEFFRFLIDNFSADIKPYVMRFVEDLKNGSESDARSERREDVQGVGDEGVQAPERDSEPARKPDATDDAGVLETEPPGNVGTSPENGDSEGTGARPRREVRGNDQEEPEGGNVPDGREGTGGAGLAASGTGTRRGTGKRRTVTETGVNYHIDNPEKLIGGTPKVRFGKNKAAIEAYQSITSEGRQPTPEELDAMAAYTGWGSFGQELFKGSWEHPMPKPEWEKESNWLREHLGEEAWKSAQNSIINAHYTDPPTVQAMWEIARRLGFKGGRVLEPSMGIGNFFGLMPSDIAEKSKLAGIELDTLTGGMAKLLYPEANIQIKGYQESETSDNFYDIIIGNWPFDKDGPADRRYRQINPSLHDYFFLKALDQVRPGGFVIGVTSSGTMDKLGKLTRLELARKGDLIAAFRLPTGAFEQYAGTAVVTDIIILQKRETPNTSPESTGWMNVSEAQVPNGSINTNEYWATHPKHVLGEMDFGHGTTRGRAGMIVNRPDNFASLLKGIVKKVPENIYNERAQTEKVISYITNNTKDRQQSVTFGPDGGLYVVQGEYLAPLKELRSYEVKSKRETGDREKQIGALVNLRKAYGALIDAERSGDATDGLRRDLSSQYNSFVKAYGSINDSYGLSLLRQVGDPFYAVLAALEVAQHTDKGTVYRGAKILRESTVRAASSIENPTVEEAYVLARNESINIDLNRIAETARKPVDEVARELLDRGSIYLTPAGNYEVSDMYLSGNVRRKLREAEAAQADGMDMARNIEELKKLIPPDQPYYKIEAKLGAPWIGTAHYQRFIAELLGEQETGDIEVSFHLGAWKVKFTRDGLNQKPEATAVWGHAHYRFNRLVQAAMNNSSVTIWTRDEHGNPIVDTTATAEANEKIGRLREEFSSWVWKENSRKVELEKEYNEVMNSTADTKYDGSFLTFSGMALTRGSSQFNLRKHQSDAIWRGLVNRSGLYAHEVGTGKTFTIGGIAVESRRYGIARKPLIFAHNANSATVSREIQEMYPAAKVLYVDNLAPERIDITMRQIANDDWDAVVVPHSLISRFGLTKETLDALAAEEIAAMEQEAIEAAADDGISLTVQDMDDEKKMKTVRSSTAKELVHARNRIIKKIEEMAQRASKENAVPFEQLGVDMIIVDEAHEFKKPPITTKMRMKGLNTGTSGQSLSLHLLTGYVKSMNAGSGVHIFTGTPITNTLNEIYHMMRYVMDGEMERNGTKAWDSWFNTFADSETDVELTASGDYEAVTRLATFVNAPELRRMAGQYMDIVFADDMPEFKPRKTSTGKTLHDNDLTDSERDELSNGRSEDPQGRPYKKIITETCPMGRQQKRILQDLKALALMFRNATGKERREMMLAGHPASPILVETAAANAGLDVRLVNKDAEFEPEGKVGRCIENLLKIYKEHDKTAQVIFMERGFSDKSTSTKTHQDGTKTKTVKERFNLAKSIVDSLVEGGIPREQIAIVDGSVSKEKRKQIADAMNSGAIRVVIGNTKTLGTGVNMQENLRAIHHLDAPWMPGELEQRNGRGHRQGNKWNTVLEIRYVTEGLDGRRWQVLVKKNGIIKKFLTADDSIRVIDGDAVKMEDDDLIATLSEAAGDPRLLLREKYKKDIEKLERRERMHAWGIVDAEEAAKRSKQDIVDTGQIRDMLKQVIDHYDKNKETFSFKLGKETYTERKKAQDALDKKLLKLGKFADHEKVGELYGFDVTARWSQFSDKYELRMVPPGMADRSSDVREDIYVYRHIRSLLDANPSIASMEAILRNLHKHLETLTQKEESLKESVKTLETAAKEPFPRAADLEKKKKMLDDLMLDLENNPVPPPSWLRNGAPVGGEVYVDGTAYPVTGHRWTSDGYFVTVDKGGQAENVPYLAVTDENNTPIYDQREFETPLLPHAGAAAANQVADGGQGGGNTRFSYRNEPDEIMVNPTRSELVNMIRGSRFKELRVVKDPATGDIYVADAGSTYHKFIAQQAGLDWSKIDGKPEYMFTVGQGDFARAINPNNQRYSITVERQAGSKKTAIEKEISPLIKKWKNAPEVKVVQSESELPENLKAEMASIAAQGEIDGVFDEGVVYLIADNMPNARDAVRVLLHEAVGHYGVRGLLGKRFDTVLLDVFYVYGKDGLREIADRYGLDLNEFEDRMIACEEKLAEIAESGEKPGLVKRAIAAIREWLRSIGVNISLSDADVRAMISRAAGWVERGKGERRDDRAIGREGQGVYSKAAGGRDYIAPEATTGGGSKDLSNRITDRGRMEEIAASFTRAVGASVAPADVALWLRNELDDLGRLGRVFQKQVVMFQSEREDISGLPGFFDPNRPDTIFINTNTPAPHLTIFGHELMHAIKNQRPDLYKKFVSAARYEDNAFDDNGKYLEKIYGHKVSDEENLEEFSADYIGAKLTEKDFWERLHTKSPQLFRSALDAVKRIIRKIQGIQFRTDHMFKDMKKAEEAALDVLNRYAKGGKAGETPRFSRRNRTGDPDTDAVLDKIGRPDKTMTERLAGILDNGKLKLEQGIFDQFAALKALDKMAGVTTPDDSAYITARMTTGFADTFTAMLNHGAPVWRNGWVQVDAENKGILKIFEPVSNDLDLFLGWMVGERAQKLMNEGRERYFTQDEIDKLKALKTPENAVRWEEVRRQYVRYKTKVLNFAEQAGVIDPEARRMWDHEEYVPFYRIAEDAEKLQGPHGKRGIASQQSGIRKLKGGTEQLGDIFENILRNFSHLTQASLKNRAAEIALTHAEGLSLASKAKWDWKAARVETEQIVKKIREELGDPDILDLEADQLNDFMTLFHLLRPKGTSIVHVLKEGKPQYYEVHDDLLLKSLTNLNAQVFKGAAMDLMRFTKRMLTIGITSMPDFMIRNFVRDTLHTWVINRGDFTPAVSSLKGAVKTFREDFDTIQLMAAGGSFHGGFAYGHDMQKTSEHVKKLLHKKGVVANILDTPAKLLDFWKKIGAAGENAARVAIYQNTVKKTGSALQAAFEAKDVMDFSMRGDFAIVKFLCETVPFLGARMQGLQRLSKAAIERPGSFIVKGGVIALASVLLYLLNRDDDRYKELEEWDKDTYFHFWVGKEHFRLPKPFEVGVLFGTIPERLTELLIEKQHDGKLFAARLLQSVTQTFAIGLPQLISEPVQQWANRDSFTGRQIVGQRIEGLKPEDQKEPWTGATAVEVGNILGVSPKRIEHAVEGYFGTLGTYVLGASDIVMRRMLDYPAQPTTKLEEWPVVKSFYRGDEPPKNTKYLTEFYDLLKEVDETYNSIQEARKTGDWDRVLELRDENTELLRTRSMMEGSRDQLSAINRRTRRILYDKDMTGDEKREELDELTAKKNSVAKRAIERVESRGIQIPR